MDQLAVFRVLYVGGNSNTNASNSVRYGLSYANANNDLSNANGNLGSRLSLENITVIPTLHSSCRTLESTQLGLVAFNVTTQAKNKGPTMRNRLKNCYEKLCLMSTLIQASVNACKPCKDKMEVINFESNQDFLLKKLQLDLINHTLVLSDYSVYYKMERGKQRRIANLPLYPDKIVHCAVAIVMEDDCNRTLIYQTHASIRGHGTHTVMMDIRRHIHNDHRICYGLSMDIDQCFGSMPPNRVKLMLRGYIKDDEFLWLLDRIIDKYNETGYYGIALGGRLSPLFANLYLSDLDHYLKEVRHVHVMERYMDNYYIFGYSREWLESIRDDVISRLGDLGLRLNDTTTIQPIDSTHGIDVVGWKIYSDHVLWRKSTKERMKKVFRNAKRKLDRCQELDEHELQSIRSYAGSLKWFDSYNLRQKIVRPVFDALAE